jgi:hypothetical protein
LGDRLQGHWISVKDFGAVGDGIADDTAEIQATFDYAFGPEGAEHGENPGQHPDEEETVSGALGSGANRIVFFPAGNYKVTEILKLNWVYGCNLIGAGSHQTRIFWSGVEKFEEADLSTNSSDNGRSTVLSMRTCWHSHLEGITLDASDVQELALHGISSYQFKQGSPWYNWENSGHEGIMRDMHFTRATNTGCFINGIAMGSERSFLNCRFTENGSDGFLVVSQNALNHWFYACQFKNNGSHGYNQLGGGGGIMLGCSFEGNLIDIHHYEITWKVIGCTSTSLNFCSAGGAIIGNRHVNASPGVFWTGDIAVLPEDDGDPSWLTGGSHRVVVIKGNYSSNGFMAPAGIDAERRVHLMGNVFDNPDYLEDVNGNLWVDGVNMNP